MDEVARLKALLRKAIWEIKIHNEDYSHVTPEELLKEMRKACQEESACPS